VSPKKNRDVTNKNENCWSFLLLGIIKKVSPVKQRRIMDLLNKTLKEIKPLDTSVMDEAQNRLDNLTKPLGSLGRLEELAKTVCAITGTTSPDLSKKTVIVMAGDHGITAKGVSLFPSEVTPQMVLNFVAGGAGINVLANHVGADVVVVDIGVASDFDPALPIKHSKIGHGTNDFSVGPAMTKEQAIASIEAGIKIATEVIENGAKIIATGDMGIGNTTSSSAIVACISGLDANLVTGRGTGLDDEALNKKAAIINEALALNKPDAEDGLDILAKVGGFEIGGIAGICLACAANRIPVVIDGFISGAGALIAAKLNKESTDYMIAGHKSVELGHEVALKYLGLNNILDFDLRLGEGTGAALAMSIVEASVKILNEMATFESAGVSEAETLVET
jgi:nicotinate-nucleotide--dimethylbenzimidazole phosphoribosyltransferase